MEIAYAAHTESCTLLLDSDGYCRRIVAVGGRDLQGDRAERCIGAQYVASMDVTASGGLVQLPQPGLPMIFARMDPHSGRISLVRTGPLTAFETREPGVATSAPPEATQTRTREPEPARASEASEPAHTSEASELGTTKDEWEIATRKMRAGDLDEDDGENNGDTDERPTWQDDTQTARFESPEPSPQERRPAHSPRATTYSSPTERAQKRNAPLPAPTPRVRTAPAPPPSAPTAPPPWSTDAKSLVRRAR